MVYTFFLSMGFYILSNTEKEANEVICLSIFNFKTFTNQWYLRSYLTTLWTKTGVFLDTKLSSQSNFVSA